MNTEVYTDLYCLVITFNLLLKKGALQKGKLQRAVCVSINLY